MCSLKVVGPAIGPRLRGRRLLSAARFGQTGGNSNWKLDFVNGSHLSVRASPLHSDVAEGLRNSVSRLDECIWSEYLAWAARALCNGKTLAFQAKDAGSIPAARSNLLPVVDPLPGPEWVPAWTDFQCQWNQRLRVQDSWTVKD